MNRFIIPSRRVKYDTAVAQFKLHHECLFYADGRKYRGTQFAIYFWDGYESATRASRYRFDASSKQSHAYIYRRAGQDCAKKSAI